MIVTAAALGLLRGCHDYDFNREAIQANSGGKAQPAGTAITAPPLNHRKAAASDLECSDQRNGPQSELCAQWESADAARDSAHYALLSLIVSVFGFGSVIYSLKQTQKTSHQEFRAYLRMEASDAPSIAPNEKIHVPMKVVNYGRTPALNYKASTAGFIGPPGWSWPADIIPDESMRPGVTLHVGRDAEADIGPEETIDAATYFDIMTGKLVVYISAVLLYDDVFGGKHMLIERLHFDHKEERFFQTAGQQVYT